jgi:uncharacterized protein (DUF952 family)
MAEGAIYHLAVADDWRGDPDAAYATSTLDRTLEEEGFIHCSFATQLQQIADLVYRGRKDVLLLKIEIASLTSQVRVETLVGCSGSFPHIYGPLNRDAVTNVTPLALLADGRLDVAAAL